MRTIKTKGFKKVAAGFTLIELMFTVAITAIAGLGTLFALQYGLSVQQSVAERNNAQRAAGDLIESTKRRFYADLTPGDVTLVIDDNGTPNNTDDNLNGTATLSFFTLDGTQVGISGSPMPTDSQALEARVVVTWNSVALRGDNQTLIMSTLLSPPTS